MDRAQPGWWGRNWKWAAPSGCLLVVVLAFGGCVGLMATVFGMLKNNTVYDEAMTRAQGSAAVLAVTGEPLTSGWAVSGNWNESGGSGEANLAIPVSGPRGSGTLYVEAEKSAGRWTYTLINFVPDGGGETIDLLADGGEPI